MAVVNGRCVLGFPKGQYHHWCCPPLVPLCDKKWSKVQNRNPHFKMSCKNVITKVLQFQENIVNNT